VAAQRAREVRRILESLLGVPFTDGNRIDVLRNGVEIFPAMLDAVRASEHTVDLLTFIWWSGAIGRELSDAVAERAASGVRVRVILDAFGARRMPDELVDTMRSAGADVRDFRVPDNWRDIARFAHRAHRKILVCDETTGFTGGVGIAEEWEGDARDPSEWRDTHFRVHGPAVDGLRAAFVDAWLECDGILYDEHDRFPEHEADGPAAVQVVTGDGEAGWSDITILKRALIDLARERIRITTAYFSPDDTTCDLLAAAARRGVEVEVLVPGRHADKRVAQAAGERTYERLLEAGAQVRLYDRTMLHAKVLTVDGLLANVGSSNFNSRSFEHDEEVDLVILDDEVTATLDAQFDEDLRWSRPVTQEYWDHRPHPQRFMEQLAALVDGHV
jgi:cardiolipin synthase A/B